MRYKKLLLIQSLGIAHCVEEFFFGFSIWATAYFGTTTQSWYVLSHIVIFALVAVIGYYAYKGFKWGIWYAIVIQVMLFTNGLFHIASTILFMQYSPGVITQLLIIPISFILYTEIRRSRLFTAGELIKGSILGVVLSIAILVSLWLDIRI